MTDLDRVTSLRPAVDDPTPEWLAATRTALLERAAEPPRRAVRRRGRGSLTALAAGIAVFAVVALVMPASSQLIAGSRVQYVYVKEGFSTGKDSALSVNEVWYPLDSGTPADFTPKITLACDDTSGKKSPCWPSGTPTLVAPGQQDLHSTTAPLDWSYQQFKQLPTDSQQLRARFYDLARSQLPAGSQKSEEDVNEQAFLLIGGVLKKAVAPQETVSALQQVLLTIPGVVIEQPAKDATGRAGIGIGRHTTTYPYDSTLVFDPGTHRFLGENQVYWQRPGYTPSYVVLSSVLVDRLGDRA